MSALAACDDDAGSAAVGGGGAGGGTTSSTGGTGFVETHRLTLGWRDALSNTPVVGVTVEVYAEGDLNTVLGTGITDAEGIAEVQVVASDAFWVAHGSAPGFRDTWYYHEGAADQDGRWEGLPIVTHEIWDGVHGSVAVTPDAAAGAIIGLVPPASQVTTEPGGSGVFYLGDTNLPDPEATEATMAGRALALNVSPGDVSVAFTGPAGLGRRTLRVFSGALTVGTVRSTSCDPIAQDCREPGADKCALYLVTGPVSFVCAPTLGSDELGDSCTRPNGYAGEDTCVAGLYCSWAGTPSRDDRSCKTLCTANSQCGTDEFCRAIRFEPKVGTCLPSCDPFDANSCSGAGACHLGADVDGRPTPTCTHPGTGVVDDPCTGSTQCAAGLHCANLLNPDRQASCRPICDAEHPCSEGSCVIASTGYGHCE